jgi:hypothetical protein
MSKMRTLAICKHCMKTRKERRLFHTDWQPWSAERKQKVIKISEASEKTWGKGLGRQSSSTCSIKSWKKYWPQKMWEKA